MSMRSEQRRLKQLEVEYEQRLEDLQALKMTEQQNETLLRSFQSVKFEFYDLDGLSWTDSVKQKLRKPKLQDAGTVASQPSFVVLTKADLASFAPEETIRPSAVRTRASQVNPEPLQRNNARLTPGLVYGKRDGTRARSPIKGLFSISNTEAHSTRNDTDDRDESPVSVCSDMDYIPLYPSSSPQTDAGVITSIFQSSVFSTHGRNKSPCSIAATPNSSPSLVPVSNFASP